MAGKKQMCQLFLLMSIGYFTVKTFVLAFRIPVIHEETSSNHPTGGIDAFRIINKITEQPVYLPFDASQPKKVVVMTYQRCGSSFFGQLFNKNPKVFYIYEPLDSLYSALYGIREGWNVPSDITTHWNGTSRDIPEREKNAVSQFLNNLLSCDVDALPTETLIHRFWWLFSHFHESLGEFRTCLGKNNFKYTRCASYTPKLCGERFGQFDSRRIEECNQFLWNQELRQGSTDIMARNISLYKQCMDNMRVDINAKCSHIFADNCKRADLRTAKTVRATMESMKILLERDSNLRVIHLIRDPRAVVLSRHDFDVSARSHYAGRDLVKESQVYCRDVVRDVRYRKILETRFPGRIMTVIYDDLTKNPMKYTEEIYTFLNTTVHKKTVEWLVKNTSVMQNSSQIAAKWKEKLSYSTAKNIMNACKHFFAEVPYNFD